MKKELKYLIPVLILFFLMLIIILSFSALLIKWNIDPAVVLFANLLFMVLTAVNFLMQVRGLNNSNPNVFIRSMMGGMLLKMAVVLISLMIYWKASGAAFNKNGVFVSLGIFFLYFVLGVYCVMLLNKSKNA
jgi:hypothetical protein